MVVSRKIYTPQTFVDILTDACYGFDGDDPIGQIHKLLKHHGVESDTQPLWDYALDEIEHIVSEKINVVLVDVSGFYENDEWEQVYRWFEVTDYEDKFREEDVKNAESRENRNDTESGGKIHRL